VFARIDRLVNLYRVRIHLSQHGHSADAGVSDETRIACTPTHSTARAGFGRINSTRAEKPTSTTERPRADNLSHSVRQDLKAHCGRANGSQTPFGFSRRQKPVCNGSCGYDSMIRRMPHGFWCWRAVNPAGPRSARGCCRDPYGPSWVAFNRCPPEQFRQSAGIASRR
jgi:hypothetical protein